MRSATESSFEGITELGIFDVMDRCIVDKPAPNGSIEMPSKGEEGRLQDSNEGEIRSAGPKQGARLNQQACSLYNKLAVTFLEACSALFAGHTMSSAEALAAPPAGAANSNYPALALNTPSRDHFMPEALSIEDAKISLQYREPAPHRIVNLTLEPRWDTFTTSNDAVTDETKNPLQLSVRTILTTQPGIDIMALGNYERWLNNLTTLEAIPVASFNEVEIVSDGGLEYMQHTDIPVEQRLGYIVIAEGPIELRTGSPFAIHSSFDARGNVNPLRVGTMEFGSITASDIQVKGASVGAAVPLDLRVGVPIYQRLATTRGSTSEFKLSFDTGVGGFLGDVSVRAEADVSFMGASLGRVNVSDFHCRNMINWTAGLYGTYSRTDNHGNSTVLGAGLTTTEGNQLALALVVQFPF